MNKLVFYLALVMCIWSCTKHDLPMPIIESPVFNLKGDLEGDQILIQAGVNDYYVLPSFSIDPQGLINYRSKFKTHYSGSEDISSFEFIINSASVFNIDSIPPGLGFYYFFNKDSTKNEDAKIRYISIVSGNGLNYSYEWKYRNFHAEVPVFNVERDTVLKYGGDVELHILDGSGLKTSYIQSALPENDPLSVDFSFTNFGQKLRFTSQIQGGNPPYFITWYDVAGDSIFQDSIPLIHSGKQEFRLTVRDSDNKVVKAQKEVINMSTSQLFSCSFTKIVIPESVKINYSKAEIIYSSPTGEIFSTKYGLNPNNKNIEILEASPYLHNSEGHETIMLKIKFDCNLYNEDGQMKSFSGIGIIVVATP